MSGKHRKRPPLFDAHLERSAVTSLPRRPLGQSGLNLSELGLGAAPLGNFYRPMSDIEAQQTLRHAVECGITYIDCAPYYGFGLSEVRVGEGLREQRDIVVSTKVGRVLEPAPEVVDDAERCGFRSSMPFAAVFDYTYGGVMASWQASLQRLGRARVEILYVHDIGRLTHGADHTERFRELTQGGGLRALAELRSGGQIDAFGIGVNEIEVCLDLMDEASLDVILLAGRYSLLEQEPLDRLFPECARRGTSIVIGGPYNSGILATGTRGVTVPRFNYSAAPHDIVHRVSQLERICEEFDVPLQAAALQFPLAHPQVSSVIPGLDGAERVGQTLAFYHRAIPSEFWTELKTRRLIREDSPVRRMPECQA